jgi:Uma2 family endonuclease
MSTIVKLSASDHGRPMSLDQFEAADYEEGFQYELIDGRVAVSPQANFSQHWLERWLVRKLDRYADSRPDIVGFVANKARVFVPDRDDVTAPEPDIALYHEQPEAEEVAKINWQAISPFIVAEVLTTDDNIEKDFTRNVELYFLVPTIREYWILDGRRNAAEPTLHVRRRHGSRWILREVMPGETYETRTLPGFRLRLRPRR